jgi:hypothetical protein
MGITKTIAMCSFGDNFREEQQVTQSLLDGILRELYSLPTMAIQKVSSCCEPYKIINNNDSLKNWFEWLPNSESEKE